MSDNRVDNEAVAVVLAAGQGTRMKSARPKMLHEVAGRPLLAHVLAAAAGTDCRRALVIVGHGAEAVRAAAAEFTPDGLAIEWVEQAEQRGTGHAVQQVEGLVEGDDRLLILSGDAPLIRASSLRSLLTTKTGALAVAEVEAPGALGRVIRDADGLLERIVEAADATADELAVATVNAGFYALPAGPLFAALEDLDSDNQQGEAYLTDAVGALAAEGRIEVVELQDPSEAWGVNDCGHLAAVDRRWIERRLDELMGSGVTVYDPASVRVEAGVEIGQDTVVHAGVVLRGATSVGRDCEIDVGCVVEDSRLDDGATLGAYSCLEGAVLEAGAHAGPFARLRSGAVLGRGARVGNFVEVKKATLGPGVKAGHLAYLGDAEIGADTNIGAGTITCNYDGVKKSKTTIGEGAFIGSDTMLVAPVEVGDGATTGAGSTITRDVPANALAVERSEQRTVRDWAERRRRRGREKD